MVTKVGVSSDTCVFVVTLQGQLLFTLTRSSDFETQYKVNVVVEL